MTRTTPRDLVEVTPEWSMTQVLPALAAALAGTGPALTFGPSRYGSVDASVAIVIPTSGSTGSPKEVALSAQALKASADAAHLYLGALPGESWSLHLPINHIAGVNVLLRSLLLGGELVDCRKGASYKPATYTSVVPTQLYRALNGDTELLTHLQEAKAVLVGGAATPLPLLSAAIAANIRIVTTYGMSEMSGGCVYNNMPLVGVEVRTSPDGRIALKGPMRADNYLGQEELWGKATDGDWFLTSDIGEVRDGLLFVHGRVDDQIISGGEKISLAAIDSALSQRYGAGLFMSYGVADIEWGSALCIASNRVVNEAEVKSYLVERFGAHASPKQFLLVQELPFTSLGKPDRKRLVGKMNE